MRRASSAPAYQLTGGPVMSGTPYTPPVGQESGSMFDYSDYDDTHGQGLVTFAGVMIMIAAVLNILYGIAAIDKANFFTHNARYVFGDLQTWGWFLLAFGVLQFFAALAIWRGSRLDLFLVERS